MRGQAGFFDVDERLKELSAKGDHLERLTAIIDFELFRADLEQAVPRAGRSRGGRPAFDHVFMFKVLVLQASHSLSDERTEFLIKDRLSFMRFLGLGLADPVPDANTIWTFREALTRAQIEGKPAIEGLFARFDAALREAGFLAMSGQIIDASIVACPKQRNTDAEKQAIKDGRIPEGWSDKPKKLAQKDRDARWTVKWSKAKPAEDGSPRTDLAVPVFGYKNHVGIDRRHGLIRRWAVTDAARYDGALLPELVHKTNTASDVWADTAYRSNANERHLANNGLRSRIHRKLAHPPQEAEGQAHAGSHRAGERAQVEGARGCRARVCAPEGSHGAGGAHDRSGAGTGEDWPGQSGVQHEAHGLAERSGRLSLRSATAVSRIARPRSALVEQGTPARVQANHSPCSAKAGFWRSPAEGLVHAHDGALGVVWAVVDLQHIFHVEDELSRGLVGDAPHPPAVWLEGVLF
jgi:IS5 family transposase